MAVPRTRTDERIKQWLSTKPTMVSRLARRLAPRPCPTPLGYVLSEIQSFTGQHHAGLIDVGKCRSVRRALLRRGLGQEQGQVAR
jgi:hypothetical protein